MNKLYTTISYKQTQKLGENLGKEIIKNGLKKKAIILALNGNLGGGKTTFLQGFAKGLGIKEKILSPTFVVMKRFRIKNSEFRIQNTKFTDFYHFDCYRLNNKKDVESINFKKIISDPKNIVAIEWPEKIKKALPKKSVLITFKFINKNKREIKIKI